MQYLVLGFLALFLLLLVGRGYVRANPHRLARTMKVAGGILSLAVAAGLAFRGSAALAIPFVALALWLMGPGGGIRWPQGWGGGSSPGQTSKVTTDTLEMELDHGTGAMRGRVLKGVFSGREIETMAPAELALLWRDCQFADPQSAQLVEAYLDRRHPTWREDLARAENEPGPGGIMSAAEAYEILGLEPGASVDDIRRAHRELMLRLHPDRGGSTYLAAKINEAKDILLRGDS